METTAIRRRQTAFRLREDVLKRLKSVAHRENRSVNNLVESVLLDLVYNKPNAVTLSAMEEARSGKDLEELDLDHFDEFLKNL